MTRLGGSNDRGAAAVFIAASLFLLAGFAALSIDIGAGTDERRQDQTGADAAALGGSLELVVYPGPGNPMQEAVDKIYQLVDDNLGPVLPSAWDACTDPGALAYPVKSTSMFSVTGGSDCISLSADFNTMRVRVPVQDVDTSFGAVLGFQTVGVSAFAEAQRNTDFGGNSGAYPTGVFDGTQVGSTICLKAGPPGGPDPPEASCGDPTMGDFGNFLPYFYEPVGVDPALSVTAICRSGEQPFSIPRAIADGVDHTFSIYGGRERLINGDWCRAAGIPGPLDPNWVDPTGGYSPSDVTEGLITGGDWMGLFAGRLARPPFVDGTVTIFRDVVDPAEPPQPIDNRPLWDFIDPDLPGSIGVCDTAAAHPAHPGTTVEYYSALADLLSCLQAAPDIIFTDELGSSPRLAASPLFWQAESKPNGCNSGGPGDIAFPDDLGVKCYWIQDFVPIFVDAIWADLYTCTGTLDSSTGICLHRTGMTGVMDAPNKGKRKLESAGALLLSCNHLSATLCQQIQSVGGPRDLTGRYDLQLTR